MKESLGDLPYLEKCVIPPESLENLKAKFLEMKLETVKAEYINTGEVYTFCREDNANEDRDDKDNFKTQMINLVSFFGALASRDLDNTYMKHIKYFN
jgi:hypothetical protein